MAASPSSERSLRPSLARRMWRPLRVVLLVYLLVLLAMVWFENNLIFPAPRHPWGDWESKGANIEDVYFDSSDGIRLHGWYIDHPHPRYYVLYCHGNGENVTNSAQLLRLLHDRLDLAVFVFDYRGYGRSDGSAHEKGVLLDARAAQAWLAQRAGLEPRELVLMGRSLGGAVAVDLAAATGARALVLESTFTSIPDVASRLYWWAPVRLVMRTQFNSRDKIQHYRGPLLQSHGDRDGLIPIDIGRSLFNLAPGKHKQFYLVEGGDHNDPQPPQYYQVLDEFLGSLPD